MAGLRTVCGSVRTRHSPVTRKSGRGSASFLERRPSSLPRFAASDDDGGFAQCKPPARLAPVMALASNDPSGLRTGRTWSHGRGSRGPAKISRAHGWHGLTSVDSRTDATPDDRTRPILRPTIDHTDSRTCADALRGESQGYLDGVPDGRLAEGMDPRVYSAGPANIKI